MVAIPQVPMTIPGCRSGVRWVANEGKGKMPPESSRKRLVAHSKKGQCWLLKVSAVAMGETA